MASCFIRGSAAPRKMRVSYRTPRPRLTSSFTELKKTAISNDRRRTTMPTYTCTVPAGRLSTEQKGAVARDITRVHNEVNGAATFFAQVIFNEVPSGNYFIGGKPLKDDQIFINGQIRAGRSAVDRGRLLRELHRVVAAAAGAQPN